MRAIILAAGKGSRLGQVAGGLPKCLLDIGGQPLLHHQLAALAEAGVGPVLVVVGYRADAVREAIGGRAEVVENAAYDTTNSLASFSLAESWAGESSLLVMNSDVLFDPVILERVARLGPDALAYDSTSGYAPEHMKVMVRGKRVASLSKELRPEDVAGENVGLFSLDGPSARTVFERARAILGAGRKDAFLAEAVVASLGVVPLKPVDVAGLPWTEIDSPFDLERARREVWPRIERRSGARLEGWKQRRRRRRAAVAIAALALLALAFVGGLLVALSNGPAGWETLPVEQAQLVTITVSGNPQAWWKVGRGEQAVVKPQGPARMRLDFRCLSGKEGGGPLAYVIEIQVDGAPHDFFRFQSAPSSKAVLAGSPVGARDTADFEVPPGSHEISVRLREGEATGVLVRFRVAQPAD